MPASPPPSASPLESKTAGISTLPLSVGVVILLLSVVLFALRLAAPPNLLDQDQERPASYVLDAVKNGHWICQRDVWGDITSKPPMWTWIAALATLVTGRVSIFTLYLPGALAACGTALCLAWAGSKRFGRRAGLFAALVLMLCPAGFKEFGLARTDGVFAFTVTVAALLAYRAWTTGKGWTWFWMAAAASTLTKGPLGLVLAAGGLIAVAWERKAAERAPLRGNHFPGIALFLLICGGWFYLSYREFGQAVIDKMIGKELLAHAMTSPKNGVPGALIWQQPLYYLARAAPWSIVACVGFWRMARRPATEPEERRFERFLFCWFFFGLFLFSMAPHQRGDLLWPIMPAGALIAGRELDRSSRRASARAVEVAMVCVVVVSIAGLGWYYFGPRARTKVIEQTILVKGAAREIEDRGGPEFPLSHVDDPLALQIYLNTLRPQISAARAAALLRGPEPAFVAVKNVRNLEEARGLSDAPWFTILPKSAGRVPSPVTIIGNRADLAASDSAAFCVGPLFVRVHHARVLKAAESEIVVALADGVGDVMVTNESNEFRQLSICTLRGRKRNRQKKLMAPTEILKLTFPAAR